MLSPTLFAEYMDDLSVELNNLNSGCYVGNVLFNHLMFADDLCVFCPSARGRLIQEILDICEVYAKCSFTYAFSGISWEVMSLGFQFYLASVSFSI